MIWRSYLLSCLFVIEALALGASDKAITVYSERKDHLIKPVFDAYTQKTGVKVTYLTDNAAALIERIKGEGNRSPADILLTVDAGNLWNASRAGLFQPIASPVLSKEIPEYLRDPKGEWYGLSLRARTVVYNPSKVKPEEIKSFEGLAQPQFKKRLCLRSSKKVYNQSLVAMMIAEKGEAATESIVKGWVQNLAAPVFQDDTNIIEAVASGQCDVGIVNSYYYGRSQEKNPKLQAKLFFPAKAEGGVHVNISGAGVLKTAPHKDEAVKLLEWLAGAEAQELFAKLNHEFPVQPSTQTSAIVQAWGPYEASLINISKAGENQEKAIKLMDRVGYN